MFSDHFLFLGNSLIFFDLLCADVAFDYATAYPILCYSHARSAGGLSTFSILVPLSTSARLCTCLFMLRSKQSRAYIIRAVANFSLFTIHSSLYSCRSRCSCSRSRAHCSRSSSTETGSFCSRCCRDGSHAPAGTVQPPYHSKELNLTSDGYSDSLAPFGRWPGFRVYCGSGTAAIHKPQQMPAGVYREKFSVSSRLTAAFVLRRGAACAARFRLGPR